MSGDPQTTEACPCGEAVATCEGGRKCLREEEKFGPGTFGCHEAFHVAAVLAETVDERLCQHPAIMMNPAWESLAQIAVEALNELYQAIGQEHCK